MGATIILTNRTFFNKEFWDMIEEQKATSIAGVPYSYEMLFNRLKLDEMDLPNLKTLTQAGGHLNPELQERIGKWAKETGRRFFVMYGQTEATARMSYIPPDRCLDKIGSIGIPVPGGKIELSEEGELIYYGANVSLGYATCREDLAKPDENKGRLETGDIAYRDEEGYLYISGRKKRFIKLQGKRISLDQIQEVLQEKVTEEIACTGKDDTGIIVWIAGKDREDEILDLFRDTWGIRGRMVEIRTIEQIPRNTSGKILYKDLK
ncbi:MAG: AMP-binding protein [Firmicutes bacterium]|nr:AMP-binding protein [Bacillota bacterium]